MKISPRARQALRGCGSTPSQMNRYYTVSEGSGEVRRPLCLGREGQGLLAQPTHILREVVTNVIVRLALALVRCRQHDRMTMPASNQLTERGGHLNVASKSLFHSTLSTSSRWVMIVRWEKVLGEEILRESWARWVGACDFPLFFF